MRGSWREEARRFEDIDKDMSSYVVSCVKKGTRLFLTAEGTSTASLSLAKRYRWREYAERAVEKANAEKAWRGFDWHPLSVPEALINEETHA